jgi:bidirectional [NiFe] hydrogenase diaphorase subunit
MHSSEPDHRTEDRQWNAVDRTMQRHDYRPEALIETLHTAQERYGFLDFGTLGRIADRLGVAPSKVLGVATFYNHFRMQPAGEHTLAVCTGTACHVKGNDRILAWAREQFGLSPGETTPDNRLSLVEVRCVGACALAPVIVTDGEIRGKRDFAESTAMIREWLGDAGR